MKQLQVNLNTKLINIYIGSNLEEIITKTLYKTKSNNQFIVSKTAYPKVKKLVAHLSEKSPIIIDSKEQNKSLESFESLLRQCYKRSLDRKSRIIGIGGGMIGDYVGFLAATYRRGIEFIYIPTTLMSQCDPVINKVALNIGGVKNLMGSFYSPTTIFCDINYIKSLPDILVSQGVTEIIKYALIKSSKLLNILESYVRNSSDRKNYNWEEIIYECVKIKLSLLNKDPLDNKGVQKGLNYGHTFAHALEDYSNYMYPHGYAVGIGIKIAGYVSRELELLSLKELNIQNRLLSLTSLDLFLPSDFNIPKFILLLKRSHHSDPKIKLILLKKIGKSLIYHQTEEELIKKTMKKYLFKLSLEN